MQRDSMSRGKSSSTLSAAGLGSSRSALDLSAADSVIEARESCERVTFERLKMWNTLSSAFENPPLCDKKVLYSPSNPALLGAPSAAGSF